MLQRDQAIYASRPLRALQDVQSAAMLPELQRCAGRHGLLLCSAPQDRSPASPLLGHWVRMQVAGLRWQGDLDAAADEPLPFLDEAFDLLLLLHVFEGVPEPKGLVDEAMRVLAPGGMLMACGVHPRSLWAPWFYWRSRGCGLRLASPERLAGWLRGGGLLIERIRRLGQPWPSGEAHTWPGHMLGGGYVLTAHKPRRLVLPLRTREATQRRPVNVGLVPGARRHSAP